MFIGEGLSRFRFPGRCHLLFWGLVLALAGIAGFPGLVHAIPPSFGSVSSNTAGSDVTSLTISVPSGTAANDLLITAISTDGSVTFNAPPTGWTLINQGQSGASALAVFYKIAGASEPASYTFTWNAAEQAAGAILRYTGVDTSTPINAYATATGNSASPTAPSVTTTVAGAMIVCIFGEDDDDNSSSWVPTGYTGRVIRKSDTGGGTTLMGAADITQASSGPTGNALFTLNAIEQWRTVTIALAPSGSQVLGCADYSNSPSPTNLSGVVNTYYPGTTGTVSIGATSIPVGIPRGAGAAIASGDLLLVMQMQYAIIDSTNTSSYGAGTGSANGAASYVTAGYYEYVVATGAVSGGAVPIAGEGPGSGLLNTYVQAAYSTQGQRTYQVVRVPQYQTATVTGTITAAPWDGSSGGIVAMDVVGQLTFSGGGINVDGQGFRGGGGQAFSGGSGSNTDYVTLATNAANGNKAEGVAGSPRYMYDGTATLVIKSVEGYPNGSRARGAPGNAGGGGTDGRPSANDQNSGGGGGGNGGAGGRGGNSWSSNLAVGGYGGAVFPYSTSRLAMGGGGGSGSRNNSGGVQSSGGLGGGIIMVRADSITGTATLNANGSWPASDNYTPENDGAGGGGAGGSVLVFARSGVLTSLTISANGGNGANAWPTSDGTTSPGNRHGPGGGGGGGVIYLSSAAGSTSVTGGVRGTTTTANDPYGASSGANGAMATTLTAANIPGTASDAVCAATLAGISQFRAEEDGGQVVLAWRTGFEIGTVGFHVERRDPVTGTYERINDRLLPALLGAPQGGVYRFVDGNALPGETYTYRLEELDAWGGTRFHGPYTVVADAATTGKADVPAPARAEAATGHGHDDPASGYRAIPNPLRPKVQACRRVNGPAASPTADRKDHPAAPSTPKIASSAVSPGDAQVKVREDGLVFVSAADLAVAMGTSESEIRQRLKQGLLKTMQGGRDVAWLGASDSRGFFFYGQHLDSLYTRDNVYRFNSGVGKKMGVISGRPTGSVAAGVFTDMMVFEEDILAATLSATDPESDYWFWEGFIGGDPDYGRKSFTLNLPDAVTGTSLTVRLNGVSSGAHPLEVRWNGQPLGSSTWSGLGNQQLMLSLRSAAVLSGANTVELTALGDAENLFFLDSFEVTYDRFARAEGNQLKVTAARSGAVAVEGFQHSDVIVLDITDPRLPVAVTGLRVDDGGSGYRVSFPGQASHRYFLTAPSAATVLRPHPVLASKLAVKDRVAYVIITCDQLAEGAQTLAELRRRRGLSARVVTPEAIYNEFSQGIADPRAIRDFLQYARGKWGSRYAVLVGSGTYDYRDLEGQGDNLVPTLMTATPYGLYACDGCFADFLGNGVPQLAVSRIPAGNAAQLRAYVNKLAAYEELQASDRTRDVLMLADTRDPLAGDFPKDSDGVASLAPPDVSIKKIYLSTTDPDPARQLTIETMNAGLFWVNYIGHGGMDRLADVGLLASGDDAVLNNANDLPVLSAMTCAVNRFEIPGMRSLGEELVLDADGGAIAVWAPTGLSINTFAVHINKSLFNEVFEKREQLLGDAIRQALAANSKAPPFMLRIYNLLGDGALLLSE